MACCTQNRSPGIKCHSISCEHTDFYRSFRCKTFCRDQSDILPSIWMSEFHMHSQFSTKTRHYVRRIVHHCLPASHIFKGLPSFVQKNLHDFLTTSFNTRGHKKEFFSVSILFWLFKYISKIVFVLFKKVSKLFLNNFLVKYNVHVKTFLQSFHT